MWLKMRIKIMLTMDVDTEVYPIPSDDRIDEEIKDYLTDLIHEVDGFQLKGIRILTGEKNYD